MRFTGKIIFITFLCLFFAYGISFAEEDAKGSKDNPYFPRMPNYHIAETGDREFLYYTFYNGKDTVIVEGRLYSNLYVPNEGSPKISDLHVRRNYINAIKSIGGIIIFEGQTDKFEDTRAKNILVTGKVIKGDKELWIEIWPYDSGGGTEYRLTILEQKAMKQDVTVSDMLWALNKKGHIALYITFDTGKSTIKPESRSIIDQIITLMKNYPDLKIGVEGHIDNVGEPKNNQVLSEDRAQAVVSAIIKQGIDASRLSASGFGQDKPIADNSTEEGRAKNRRVELVKK